jgi:hypothetical protein
LDQEEHRCSINRTQKRDKYGQGTSSTHGFKSAEVHEEDGLEVLAHFEANFGKTEGTEVIALFGKAGLGRKIYATLGMVSAILHAIVLTASGALLSPMFILAVAWFIAMRYLFDWGTLAQEKQKAMEKARKSDSPKVKADMKKRFDKLTNAEKGIHDLKSKKPWKDPKVAAKLAKRDPAQVKAVLNAIQTA